MAGDTADDEGDASMTTTPQAHDGEPCTYVGTQGAAIVVFECRCGATRELAAAQPVLDRRAALQQRADVDKTLRAEREAGRLEKLPWFGWRRPGLD